jgi:hypothetical protein
MPHPLLRVLVQLLLLHLQLLSADLRASAVCSSGLSASVAAALLRRLLLLLPRPALLPLLLDLSGMPARA